MIEIKAIPKPEKLWQATFFLNFLGELLSLTFYRGVLDIFVFIVICCGLVALVWYFEQWMKM